MNFAKYALPVLFLGLPYFAFTQNRRIQLSVLDELQKPISNATVQMLLDGNETMIKTDITNKTGQVYFNEPPEGNYIFKVTALGFNVSRSIPVKSPFEKDTSGSTGAATFLAASATSEKGTDRFLAATGGDSPGPPTNSSGSSTKLARGAMNGESGAHTFVRVSHFAERHTLHFVSDALHVVRETLHFVSRRLHGVRARFASSWAHFNSSTRDFISPGRRFISSGAHFKS